MKDTEKELREKLGITDPLQLLPVDGNIIPTEKIQRDFTSKISDDFLAELMKDRKLSTEQQQQVLNSVKDDKVAVIEGYPSINNSIVTKNITKEEAEKLYSQKQKIDYHNDLSRLPPVDIPSPKITHHTTPIQIIRKELPSINSSDKKETFSERFKDAQRRIQLEETHKVISVNNPVIKLK